MARPPDARQTGPYHNARCTRIACPARTPRRLHVTPVLTTQRSPRSPNDGDPNRSALVAPSHPRGLAAGCASYRSLTNSARRARIGRTPRGYSAGYEPQRFSPHSARSARSRTHRADTPPVTRQQPLTRAQSTQVVRTPRGRSARYASSYPRSTRTGYTHSTQEVCRGRTDRQQPTRPAVLDNAQPTCRARHDRS